MRHDADPEALASLDGFLAALAAAERPWSTLNWLTNGAGAPILSEMLHGTRELSHEALDTTGHIGVYLRAAFVEHGALAPRREADRITAVIDRELERLPSGQDRTHVRTYAHWQVVHDLVRREQRGETSYQPTATGSSVPYKEPAVGGTYGGYVAEVWTFADQDGCSTMRGVNTTDVSDANANEMQGGGPTGTALFYFMGGPGSDPNYDASNPSASEAYNWGYNQAYYAYKYYAAHGPTVDDPIMFMDIENPENGTFQGWQEETDKCGDLTGSVPIPSSIDRQTFDGFSKETSKNTPFFPGVYARQDYWDSVFGTGSNGSIPNTEEWTSQSHNVTSIPGPTAWCTVGACAKWFGGVTSDNEAEWQWAIAPTGDYDQIDSYNVY